MSLLDKDGLNPKPLSTEEKDRLRAELNAKQDIVEKKFNDAIENAKYLGYEVNLKISKIKLARTKQYIYEYEPEYRAIDKMYGPGRKYKCSPEDISKQIIGLAVYPSKPNEIEKYFKY
ncbi:hypothetical protein OAL66_01785 [bacterium]|nr:hypothetical protein [bacterium]